MGSSVVGWVSQGDLRESVAVRLLIASDSMRLVARSSATLLALLFLQLWYSEQLCQGPPGT